LNAVESLLAKKKKLVDDFEKEYADEVELVE
jgi:hypothetical protein